MFGEWLARGALACERRHRRGLRHRLLGGDLVLGGCALQLLELQLDLIEKPRRPLRPGAIELAGQLLDLQLLMRNQRLIVGGLGAGHRQFGFGLCCPGLHIESDEFRAAFSDVDVAGRCATIRIHVSDRIINR